MIHLICMWVLFVGTCLSYQMEKISGLENMMVTEIHQLYLWEMEDKISLCVSARIHIEPQLPHEEDVIRYADRPA